MLGCLRCTWYVVNQKLIRSFLFLYLQLIVKFRRGDHGMPALLHAVVGQKKGKGVAKIMRGVKKIFYFVSQREIRGCSEQWNQMCINEDDHANG